MTDVNYSDVILNGGTPYLTPAADLAALNARSKTDLINGARCRVLDEELTYQYDGANWVDPNGLVWESITAGTGWTSNAYIAKIMNDKFAIMRGNFVSTTDQNTGAVFAFPTGYLPLYNQMRVAVASLLGGSHYIKYGGKENWSGGGNTLTISQPGVTASDKVICTINNVGTGGPPKTSIAGTPSSANGGEITFKLQSANTNNDVEFSWIVPHLQATIVDSLRASTGTNDVTYGMVYNNNDRIYVEGVTYALSGS